MRTVETYLSRVAGTTWPGALVWREDAGEAAPFTLERPGEPPVGLGAGGFPDAKRALQMLRRSAGARGSGGPSSS
jgi:hypothetical protein